MWGNESCQKQGDYEAMLRDSERTGKQNRKPGIAQKKKKKNVCEEKINMKVVSPNNGSRAANA